MSVFVAGENSYTIVLPALTRGVPRVTCAARGVVLLSPSVFSLYSSQVLLFSLSLYSVTPEQLLVFFTYEISHCRDFPFLFFLIYYSFFFHECVVSTQSPTRPYFHVHRRSCLQRDIASVYTYFFTEPFPLRAVTRECGDCDRQNAQT